MDPSLIVVLGLIPILLVIGHYSIFVFIELLLVALTSILVGYMLRKSKPTRQSFTDFKINFEKFSTLIVANDINNKCRKLSWYEAIIQRTFTKALFNLTKVTVQDSVIFDIGIGLVAFSSVSLPLLSNENDKNTKSEIIVFLGVVDAWFPITTK
jgi:hypothetical protein